jgi:hypothetical protein
MKKGIYTVILLAIVVLGAAAVLRSGGVFGGVSSGNSANIKIGLMSPLSGEYAVAGENYQKGIELALDEYRVKNPDAHIELVVEDDGFDVKKGICGKESAERTRQKTLNNYEKCVQTNLLIKGAKSRFVFGDKGRTKELVSAQTKARLKERLKEPYMIDAMKKSGEKLGKSGLGNKKRWENKK